MNLLLRRILVFALFLFVSQAALADSLADAAARAGVSVESQAEGPEVGIVIGTDTATRERCAVIFRRDTSGVYRIEERDLISRVSVSPASAPEPTWSANLATVEASLQAQSQSRPLSIPEGRSLSDGMVRSTQDQVRAWARNLKSENSPADAYRSIQKRFEALISDIGWIDVRRFGVPSACDAASIVELSASRRLMEGALPIMEKTLKNAEGGEACYARALTAYQKLIEGR